MYFDFNFIYSNLYHFKLYHFYLYICLFVRDHAQFRPCTRISCAANLHLWSLGKENKDNIDKHYSHKNKIKYKKGQ